MNLSKFPRRRYTQGATPIEELARLSEHLGGPQVYIKRDDLLGLAGGGNKTRKLEFVVADALEKGADTLITCGAVQSNHCRLTLAAAIREGMKCRLVLEERVPNSYDPGASGNNFLYRLMGVERIEVVPGGTDMMEAMEKVAEEVKAAGGHPYIIPGGASNPIGATGYASCALEIVSQSFELGLDFDAVICASGSGGTHSGLLAGLVGMTSDIAVIGISVRRKKEEQEAMIYELTQKTCRHLGIQQTVRRDAVTCFDEYVGPGYSLPTEQMVEAVKMLAEMEGILLDPVYTGKTMAGLVDLIRKKHFKREEKLLFLHTGGAPALYANQDLFLKA